MNYKFVRTLAPLFLILAIVIACNFSESVKKGIEQAAQPKVVKSKDGKTQLTVPSTWIEDPTSNPAASLQVVNALSGMYAAIITEGRQDFSKTLTLDKVTELIREQQGKRIEGAQFTEPVPTTINGHPAMQYEVRGTIQNVNLAYLNTVVETPDNYHQILTWTLQSKFDANKPTLAEVAQSFKEMQGAGATSPATDNTAK